MRKKLKLQVNDISYIINHASSNELNQLDMMNYIEKQEYFKQLLIKYKNKS